ncbi:MAG: AAA family ATPase [Saprospiraceae bacterium]|nr:AAA family ATPase [Saprospiraceae bacterium]
MKIAFRGFRGFGKHSEFFDINSITVLTGKNGSGKSTFLKLLDLISTSFSNINKMEDFFSITIDIGNDLFGGKNNMLHSNKMPKMIIETRFEFYIELYEVHFNFEVQDYTMKIKEIELVSKKDKIRVCSWGGNLISANCKYLYKEYQEKAFIYNFMEEYLYYHDDDKDYMNSDDYQLTYYNPQLEYNFIDSLKKHHISPSNEMMYNYIGMKTESQEFSHPFKELYHPGGLGNYIILDIPYEPISLTKKQIYKILKESEYFDELESFQNYGRSKDYNDFNIYESFGLMYKFEVENFLLGNSTKQYNDINVEFERAFLMMAEQNKMKFFGFKAATNGAISDDSLILKKIVLEKIHILYYLAKHSSGIFENKIIDLCTFLEIFKNIQELIILHQEATIFMTKLIAFQHF